MNKQTSKSIKNPASKIFLITLTLSFLFNPFFNPLNAQQPLPPGTDIYVNYVGNTGGQPVFLVKFINKDKVFENLHISNKEGLILYKEKLTEEKFTKRFQIDIPTEESVELILSFTDKEGKRVQKFVVNSNMLMVRNVEVTKL